MKKLFILCSLCLIVFACTTGSNQDSAKSEAEAEVASQTNADYDPKRGEGKFSAENVKVDAALNTEMALEGQKVFDMKCGSCHKLSDERLVGPGWKGVTAKHAPEWLLNFITNPDPMIDKDPELQAQLELCMVRMPNQSLSDTEARNIYEFMRKNDGVK